MNKTYKPHIIITGGSGFIGSSLIDYFVKKRLFNISVLTTKIKKSNSNLLKFYQWKLGDNFPGGIKNIDENTTLIHLAHEWTDLKDNKLNINYSGTIKLFMTAQQSNLKNILFSSSISSTKDAHNVYGRIKNRIEENINENILVLRIGVIFGGSEKGQWGLIKKICKISFLPMIGVSNRVHTIHINDLCLNINNIITQKFKFQNPIYLGSSKSITFGKFLKFVGRYYHNKNVSLIPIPKILIKILLKVLDKFSIFNFLGERIKGLQKSNPHDEIITFQNNKVLIKNIDYFINKKNKLHIVRQSLIEGYVLFKYLSKNKPKFSHLKSYSRITLKKYTPYNYFYFLKRFPSMFKIIDPITKYSHANINEKCYIMMLIAETQNRNTRNFKNFIHLLYLIPFEIIIYPIRLIFSLIFWRKIND